MSRSQPSAQPRRLTSCLRRLLQCGEGCEQCQNLNGTCTLCERGRGLIDDECKPCSGEGRSGLAVGRAVCSMGASAVVHAAHQDCAAPA